VPTNRTRGAQAYPAFVAWLALNGSRADVVLAFLANLAAWGENCGQVAAAVRESCRAGDDAVGFFDFFAQAARALRAPCAGRPAGGTRRGRLALLGPSCDPAPAGMRAVLLGRARGRACE
jgi:hypothetical protein